MKFEKRNFMGIELDVLVGHPEHELLFMATQAALAAGLKHAKQSVGQYLKRHSEVQAIKMGELNGLSKVDLGLPNRPDTRRWETIWLVPEATLYGMLFRGHAPQSEPFRKWVTEEVLPTIRKTGKYNAESSTNPIAMGVMDELKALRGEVCELKALIQGLSLNAPTVAAESPYIGTTKGTVHFHCDARLIREAAETIGLSRPVTDRLVPRVVLRAEAVLSARWDGPKLEFEVSAQQRKWTVYPTDWLKKQLTRQFIRETLQFVVNEALPK